MYETDRETRGRLGARRHTGSKKRDRKTRGGTGDGREMRDRHRDTERKEQRTETGD